MEHFHYSRPGQPPHEHLTQVFNPTVSFSIPTAYEAARSGTRQRMGTNCTYPIGGGDIEGCFRPDHFGNGMPEVLTRTKQRRAQVAGSQERPVKSLNPKPEPASCHPKTILPSRKRQSG